MHSWFTQRLNEMIGLAQYCQFPVLMAHFVMTQQAVDEIYNERKLENTAMERILSLMVEQAEIDNKSETAHHLRRALHSLNDLEIDSTNVVKVNFESVPDHNNRSSV